MAQVVVDSSVMRDKAKTLENAAVTIQSLYAEMLQEVTTTANKMKGTTIETEKKQFANIIFSGYENPEREAFIKAMDILYNQKK